MINYLLMKIFLLRIVLQKKTYQKSIHFQIEDYLTKKKLTFYNHSTDLCLAQLIGFVATRMDKQMHTCMILVDLQKELDTMEFFLKKWNILVSGHPWLNGLGPMFQTESFGFVLIMSFLRLEHWSKVYHKSLFLDRSFFYYM